MPKNKKFDNYSIKTKQIIKAIEKKEKINIGKMTGEEFKRIISEINNYIKFNKHQNKGA